uniref:hypothetical protein n=1 Tax=Deinococcus sp. TaxID=47478 RepID=UPI0025D7773B
VAWLGVAINLVNSLVGTGLGWWLIRQPTGKALPGLDPTVTGMPTIALGQPLDPALQVSWVGILGLFVVALVFRIGVQQRENEERLRTEQELTV